MRIASIGFFHQQKNSMARFKMQKSTALLEHFSKSSFLLKRSSLLFLKLFKQRTCCFCSWLIRLSVVQKRYYTVYFSAPDMSLTHFTLMLCLTAIIPAKCMNKDIYIYIHIYISNGGLASCKTLNIALF